MANTMVFELVGSDGISTIFDGAGESAAGMAATVDASSHAAGAAVDRFTRDANGRLRDARGRFVDAGTAAAIMAAEVAASTAAAEAAVAHFTTDANGRLRDAHGRFVSAGASATSMAGEMESAAAHAAPSLTATGGHLESVGTAAVHMGEDVDGGSGRAGGALRRLMTRVSGAGSAAAGALPSLGSMGPVLTGIGIAAAITLLPALGAVVPMLVGAGLAAAVMKSAFSGTGAAVALAGTDAKGYRKALKAMSPEQRAFTKEVVSTKKEFSGLSGQVKKIVLPAFTTALKAAKPVIDVVKGGVRGMATTFAGFGTEFGKLFGSRKFSSDLRANMTLGIGFIHQLISPIGSLISSLLHFGAVSGPTLDAFGHGIGGLLGSGLPGFFSGLEHGIAGSATMLVGLFGAINHVLPALGNFVGAVAQAAGPALREMFTSAGTLGAGAFNTLGRAVVYIRPLFNEFAAATRIISIGLGVVGTVAGQVGKAVMQSLWPSFRKSQDAVGPLQRLATWLTQNKIAVLDFSRAASGGILDFLGATLNAVPVVIQGFRLMLTGILTVFDGLISGAAKAFGWVPGLGGKLKAANRDFDSFKNGVISGLHTAEDASRDFAAKITPRLERNKLQMNIDSWTSQIAVAKGKLATVPPSKRAALRADISDLQRKVGAARADLARVVDKTVSLRVVTTHVAGGGKVAHEGGGYAGGGYITGPGTGTSDDVPLWGSDGEFMVNARATARNRRLLEAINDGADAQGYASGGHVKKRKPPKPKPVPTHASSSGLWNIAHVVDGPTMVDQLVGSTSQIASMSAKISNAIQQAYKGVRATIDDRLVAMVQKDNTRLQGLAKDRDRIAKTIAEAKAFASSTTATAVGTASLSSLGDDTATTGGGGILAGLQAKLGRIRNFTSYINTLAKRGLSKDLLRQLVEMGPETGFAYASALAGSSQTMLAAINRTEGAIASSSHGLGNSAADALYDSGKNSGKGFLAGLQSQQKAIESLMVKIAKGMQAALRKALGIRSPSTVLAVDGEHSVEGVAVGAIRRLPFLQRAMDRVAGVVSGTQLGMPVVQLPAPAAGGGGRPTSIVINITSFDPLSAGREVRKALLELKRVYGVNIDLGLAGG